MADVGVGCVVDAVKEFIVPLVKRQCQYMCCLNMNIESLEKEYQNLKNDEVELQMKVSQEEDNGREIIPEVESWVEKTKKCQCKIKEITDLIPSVRSGCLNIISRYSLSRDAKKTSEDVQNLRGQRPPLDSIARDRCPVPIPPSEAHEFQSRKLIEETIMDSLKHAKGNIVLGIVGMGGLGKTTMAERIKHKMETENLVDKAVMVIISQPVDMLTIQLEIGELLGLKDIKEQQTVQARAQMLHTRLTGKGRFLIVLDDIWQALDLREVGIPSKTESTKCLVLLTSRNRDALTKMNANIFAMTILSKEEAMVLFKDKARICNDNQIPIKIVEYVVRECNGLPISLVTLGTALIGEKIPVWKDTLRQLRASNPENLEPVLESVYKPLHRSYEFLKNEGEKSLFLLCSLFPEDFNISFETLTYYGMGLNMFNVVSLHDARDRVYALVSMLKRRSLLLDSEKVNHVRMHDVVRDVAIFIAFNEGRNWISMFPNSSKASLDLMSCNSPELQLMIIHLKSHISNDTETNGFSILEGKESLKVLSLENFPSKALPQSIELPKTLQTLHMVDCELCSISMVGELQSLEILVCVGCKKIKDLPKEIGKLMRLKLLHFENCKNLERIEPGVLSKLVKLEELNMIESFTKWESIALNENERKNASLKELESLTKLVSLTIEISESNLVGEEIPHSNVKKLTIGGCRMLEKLIKLPEVATQDVFPILEYLRLSNLPKLKQLCNCPFSKESNSFKNLKYLNLIGLPSLMHLFESADQYALLSNVREIEIRDCKELRNVFLLERATTKVISRLEYLTIRGCQKMEEVLCNEESRKDGRSCAIQFEKLKELNLSGLSKMTTFGKGFESIEFPMLEYLDIYHTPKLVSIVSKDGHDHDGQSSYCLFNNQVKFDKLKTLYIWHCNGIKNLFSTSIVQDLSNLRLLNLQSCQQMERVIVDENELQENFVDTKNESKKDEGAKNESKKDEGAIGRHITFPKLEHLILDNLPSLMTFSGTSEIESIEFPLLENLYIKLCPEFRYMIPSSKDEDDGPNLHDSGDDRSLHLFCNKKVKFDKLEALNISDCNGIKSLFSTSVVQDLNNLRSLDLESCQQMERVIVDEKEMQENFVDTKNESKNDGGAIGRHITFPKLGYLRLDNLPSLMTFSGTSEIESIEFPLLKKLNIQHCPEFRYMIPSSKDEDDGSNLHDSGDDKSLHLFCNKKVKFDSLKFLFLSKFNFVSNILCEESSSDTLESLEHLRIWKFPLLRCVFDFTVQLSSLELLHIGDCPQMEFLTRNLVITPKLREVFVDGTMYDVGKLGEIDDLNAFIRQNIQKESTSYEIEDDW